MQIIFTLNYHLIPFFKPNTHHQTHPQQPITSHCWISQRFKLKIKLWTFDFQIVVIIGIIVGQVC